MTFIPTIGKQRSANQVADALKRLGVTREQKMALLMENKPEVFFTFYGMVEEYTFIASCSFAYSLPTDPTSGGWSTRPGVGSRVNSHG